MKDKKKLKLNFEKETISKLEMGNTKGGLILLTLIGWYVTSHVDINTWADEGCPGTGWGI